MQNEIIFYLISAWMIIGGPFVFIAFSKSDKVNKYLYENKKSFWLELGSFTGMFNKVDSSSKDPSAIMKFNWAVISGKINREVDDQEILSDLKTIKVCSLIWNLMGIPIMVLFFKDILNL